jgi:hypothetical protein
MHRENFRPHDSPRRVPILWIFLLRHRGYSKLSLIYRVTCYFFNGLTNSEITAGCAASPSCPVKVRKKSATLSVCCAPSTRSVLPT